MKKKLLIAIPFCLLGCQGTSQVTAQGACEVPSLPEQCETSPHITLNPVSQTVSPLSICMTPGQTIEVRVQSRRIASIAGKDGGWPKGDGKLFPITAPDELGEYDYHAHFDNGVCVESRITVK